jgi:spore coat polysaccharide biosynthesis protein SpsF
MSIVGVIVARMTSSRLPGKPLASLAGRTSLERHWERLARVDGLAAIFLATSRDPNNEPLVAEARRLGMEVFRGESEDVVKRFVSIGRMAGAEALVRVGCDKPLFCYHALARNIAEYRGEDYVHFTGRFTSGLGCEILSLAALEEVHRYYRGTAIAQYVREHPHRFRIRPVAMDRPLCRPEYRLSLDTQDDLSLLQRLFEGLGGATAPSALDALRFLDDNPEIARINRNHQERNVNLYCATLETRPVLTVVIDPSGGYVALDRSGQPIPYPELAKLVADRERWTED